MPLAHLHYYNGANAVKNCSMKYKKCIQFAAKVAADGKYLKTCPCHPPINRLEIDFFNSILQLNEASQMYKILHVSEDSNAKKINFNLRNKVSQRITRNG